MTCTCPTTEAGALDHGGSWTDEDCPLHGRVAEAHEWDDAAYGCTCGWHGTSWGKGGLHAVDSWTAFPEHIAAVRGTEEAA